MCPPVPPPAISRRIVPGSFLDRLTRHRQEDPHRREADDQRRAARRDERQRDARDRDQPDDHADVDERLDADPGRDASREQGTEGVRGPERGPDPEIPEGEEQDDHEAAPEQAELLADDREDVVVERVGQEQPAGEPALAEAGPEQPAETQGEVPLDAVEPDAGRVRPRVEPGVDAVHLVAAQEHHRDGRDRREAKADEVQDVRAGEEEHRERGEREHGRGAEVRLQQHQDDDRDDDHEERDGPAEQAADRAAALRKPVGEVDHERELHELGRVDRGQRADLEPAGRTADLDVDRGDEHEDQARDADQEHRDGRDPEPAVVDPHHHQHRDDAQRRPQDLRPHDRERVVALEERLDGRGRVDHQDPDGRQGHDRDEDPVLGLVTLAAERVLGAFPGRGAERGERRRGHQPASPLSRATAAMNARPRAA
jgi:hypothetical protein